MPRSTTVPAPAAAPATSSELLPSKEELAAQLIELTRQSEALEKQIKALKAALIAQAAGVPLDLGKVKVLFPEPTLLSKFDPDDDDDAELLDKLRGKCGRKFSTLFPKVFSLTDKFRESAYRELVTADASQVIRWLEKPSSPRVMVSTK